MDGGFYLKTRSFNFFRPAEEKHTWDENWFDVALEKPYLSKGTPVTPECLVLSHRLVGRIEIDIESARDAMVVLQRCIPSEPIADHQKRMQRIWGK
jgi:hypothetical protein